MSYWLIILIVTLALAPLWQFLPSPRQRQQSRLREAAALAGLFVEFRDLPLPPARRERMPTVERQVLYYGLRLPATRATGRSALAWWREDDGWRGAPGVPKPPPISRSMPDCVLAISYSDSSCGCYWREEGGPEKVEEIAGLLRRWVSELDTAD